MTVEHGSIDVFELSCWRRLLRVSWTARRSNQSILKEISPEYSWKDSWWSWNSNTLATWCEGLTHQKRPDVGKDWMLEEKQTKEDEMVGWHRVGVGQGSLVCCSSWGCKASDTTEWLNWTELVHCSHFIPPLLSAFSGFNWTFYIVPFYLFS